MIYDNDSHIEWSTGRREYANGGIIGLSSTGEVTEGYDGILIYNPSNLSIEERAELADYMIAKWQQFKEAK